MMAASIRPVTLQDADIVSRLVGALFDELRSTPSERASDLNLPLVKSVLAKTETVSGFLLEENGLPVGIIMLTEATALYAEGAYGVITELYVVKERRSSGCAEALINAAEKFGKDKGWSMLEVGAPRQPKWQRSLNFYLDHGFSEIGPRLRRRM